jgi:putative transposase
VLPHPLGEREVIDAESLRRLADWQALRDDQPDRGSRNSTVNERIPGMRDAPSDRHNPAVRGVNDSCGGPDNTADDRPLRVVVVRVECTCECIAIEVGRHRYDVDVVRVLDELAAIRGARERLRSGNGSEFTAKALRGWLGKVGVKTLDGERGSPWENGYVESLNDKLRDELLSSERFCTVAERHECGSSAGASVTTACVRTVRSAAARRHRWRSLLDRPPLLCSVSSSGFRIGCLLRKLYIQHRERTSIAMAVSASCATSMITPHERQILVPHQTYGRRSSNDFADGLRGAVAQGLRSRP